MSASAPETNLLARTAHGEVENSSIAKQLEEVRAAEGLRNPPATAGDIKDKGSSYSLSYFDTMRHNHLWDNLPSHGKDGFSQSAAFLSQKYLVAPVAETAFYGGIPGAATGAVVGLGVLGAEAAASKLTPSVQPFLAGRPGAILPGTIGRCAETGLLIGAADYGVSMLADKTFGVDSSIAHALKPNFVGIALATTGVLLTRNPRAMVAAGLTGYGAGKVYNYFDRPTEEVKKP